MKSGFVALIGRPNVGKSTLMNHLLGRKISITCRKPQTTRHRILGIKTCPDAQLVFVDMPGIHPAKTKALNRYLNKTAIMASAGVDAIILLLDGCFWHLQDEAVLQHLAKLQTPVILAINKVDRLDDKTPLLDFLQQATGKFNFQATIAISALKNTNLEQLQKQIIGLLPEGDLIYPAEQITDRSQRFMAAEIVREKLSRRLGDELPYAITVEIERYLQEKTINKIYAIIWVESNSQKSIVIGKHGEMLKKIGSEARGDIEKLTDKKAYLQLWVKVKKSWSSSEQALKSLGFNEV